MQALERPSLVVPLLISVGLYFGIIFCIFYYTGYYDKIVKKYTSKKDDFLEVALVQKNKNEKSIKPQEKLKIEEQVIEKKSEQPKKEEENKQKTSIKEQVSAKDLFGKIKVEKTKPKPIPINKNEPTKQSRLKSDKKTTNKASKLISSLNIKSPSSLSALASSTGEYDKFKGEVQEILDGYWQQTSDTIDGSEANVKIQIDKNGNFSYDIVNLSYNSNFNEKLLDFLDRMKNITFPQNLENVPPMTIKFTDQWSNR